MLEPISVSDLYCTIQFVTVPIAAESVASIHQVYYVLLDHESFKVVDLMSEAVQSKRVLSACARMILGSRT